jgi:hypothetical protein
MKITLLIATAALCAATAADAQNKKQNSAQGQLNQANQSGRTFDGNRSSSGNSTLNQGDAVVRQPATGSNRTPQQAIQDYRNSGAAQPSTQSSRRRSAEPPPPGR